MFVLVMTLIAARALDGTIITRFWTFEWNRICFSYPDRGVKKAPWLSLLLEAPDLLVVPTAWPYVVFS